MRELSSEDRAYREIVGMIVSQKYPPGSALVESQLATQLNMSRTPVRNALCRLVSDGLLDNPSNKSCMIPVLTRKDLEDLFHLRVLVEPRIARLAAERFDEAQRAYFADLLEQERRYGKDPEVRAYDINEKLHFGVARMSRNEYFQRTLKQFFWRCQLYLFFFDSFYIKPEGGGNRELESNVKSAGEHEELLEAIFRKDADEAESVMRRHVESTHAMLTSDVRRS